MQITRKQLSFFPTQHGFLFLGILTAMLLGSINYNNNAGFILVFLLGTMVLISLFHSYENLTGLEIRCEPAQPVFAGQGAGFSVRIQAARKGTSRFSGQALSLEFSNSSPAAVSLPENQADTRVVLKIRAPKRGQLDPGPLTLESVFPFGLFRLSTRIENPPPVLVYPAPEPGLLSHSAAGDTGEGSQKAAQLGPDDFQGLDTYQPGHPLGRISWKTLSKGRGLFVKNFIAETGQEILLDLDKVKGRDVEHQLSILCRAVLELDAHRQRYGLKLSRDVLLPPDAGKDHQQRVLKALALYQPMPRNTPGAPEKRGRT